MQVKLVDFAHVAEGDGVVGDNFSDGLCSLLSFSFTFSLTMKRDSRDSDKIELRDCNPLQHESVQHVKADRDAESVELAEDTYP
ncbi:hypothetical protein MUK42_33599, partial [Musa troglodytarum]